jgi:cytochrome c peroxidase
MDGLKHDVGTKASHDLEKEFDTPQLNNVHLQAPYLHDGRCYTLEEIWTVFNPDDTHGQTNDMTKEMLNDLIEYLKTL